MSRRSRPHRAVSPVPKRSGPTRARTTLAVLGALAGASAAPATAAAAGFTPTAQLAQATTGLDTGPRVAAAPDGTAFAAWVTPGSPGTAVVAVRSPGGEWQKQELGAASVSAGGLPVAVSADGSATVVLVTGDGKEVHALTRPPGGVFGNPRTLTQQTANKAATVALAVNASGEAVAAWRESADGGKTWTPRAALRDAGGWAQASSIGPTGPVPAMEALANDPLSAAINDAGRAAVGFGAFATGGVYRSHLALRAAGKVFPATAAVLSTGAAGLMVRVAVTPLGRVLAAYHELPVDGQSRVLFRAAPSDGNALTDSYEVSVPEDDAVMPSVVAGPGEQFHGVWQSAKTSRVSYLHVPIDGVIVRRFLSPLGAVSAWPSISVDAAGNRFASWLNLGDLTVQGAFRGAGEADFGAVRTVPAPSAVPLHGLVTAPDGRGNTVMAWTRLELDGSRPVQLAAFDAEAPTLSGFSTPGSPVATTAAPFSVTARDTWSSPSVSWAFGDGASASGAAVEHAYAGPGPVTASVTATDGAGNTANASGSVAVAPHPGVDADRDGYLQSRDCNDADARVHPTAKDVPGNGVDENCDGHDAAFRTIDASGSQTWSPVGRRGIRFTKFEVTGVRVGDRVKLRCAGPGCRRSMNVTKRVKKVGRTPVLVLTDRVRGAVFRKTAKLTVTISREDFSTKIVTYEVVGVRNPKKTTRCMIPNSKKAVACT